MRVLVTGGAGFIGSHSVERLVAGGHQILVVDDLSSGRLENLPRGVAVEVATVAAAAASGLAERFRPEAIVHLAAQVDARRSVEEPLVDAQVNLIDTLALAAAARRAGTRRFVFASSAAVYGDPERIPTPEAEPTRPISPYGVAKRAVELYLEALAGDGGPSFAALRFANVYGPRQSAVGEAGVVAVFCRRLAAGEPPRIHGDGGQTRDYVHAADVAEAIALALAASTSGVWNVSTGIETSVNTLFARLAASLAPGLRAIHDPPRAGDPRRSALSFAGIESALGWRPRTPLSEGLAATAAWFRAGEGKKPS
jgi:UDP-glucose 4-epimerase